MLSETIWLPLLELDEVYYPNLVHRFYTNLYVKQSGNIKSMVQGKVIKLSQKKLAQILGVPNEGETVFFWETGHLKDHVDDEGRCLNILFGERHMEGQKLKAKNMHPTPRIINKIMAKTILPSHYNEVTHFQVFRVICIMVGRKLNMPYIIMQYIQLV